MWNSKRSSRWGKRKPRQTLLDLVREQMREANPELRLRESAQRGMSQREKRKRSANGSLLSLAEHGKVIGTGIGKEPFVAARWMGQDYVVTRSIYIPGWRDWPDSADYRSMMRQSSRALCTRALRDIGYDFGYDARNAPWMPGLKPYLESVGVCRLVPTFVGAAKKRKHKFFEDDSLIHWCHHLRDGVYDVWAGMKLNKNGDPIWLGQDEDDNNKAGFVPCQYNQAHADGYGIAYVFRFRTEFVELLPQLLYGT